MGHVRNFYFPIYEGDVYLTRGKSGYGPIDDSGGQLGSRYSLGFLLTEDNREVHYAGRLVDEVPTEAIALKDCQVSDIDEYALWILRQWSIDIVCGFSSEEFSPTFLAKRKWSEAKIKRSRLVS